MCLRWATPAYLKPPRVMDEPLFGLSLALSSDGRPLAVGAIDHSSATGVQRDQTDRSTEWSGAVLLC